MQRTTLSAILILVTLMNIVQSSALVQRRTFFRPNVLNDHGLLSTTGQQHGSTSTQLAESLSHSFDPSIEAELCSTMAHVALDFSGLVSPSRSIVRLLSVIGRLFAISADYLPDHSIHTEELMIQMFLLSLALRELLTDRLGSSSSASDGRP